MPQETKNIIQLKESTSGPNFYPETHKAAIVGKEDYSYLGEVVSPGGGGGGSTGTKGLSVSPRQSIIVNRAIPRNPRKGKKYYFSDGQIKVKKPLPHSSDAWADCIYVYDSQWNAVSERSWVDDPCIVTILDEGEFSIQKCSVRVLNRDYNALTESPFLIIEHGHIINTKTPTVNVKELNNRNVSFAHFDNIKVNCTSRRKFGRWMVCTYPRRMTALSRMGEGDKSHNRGWSTSKNFIKMFTCTRYVPPVTVATCWVFDYRRHHKSTNAVKLIYRRGDYFPWRH